MPYLGYAGTQRIYLVHLRYTAKDYGVFKTRKFSIRSKAFVYLNSQFSGWN